MKVITYKKFLKVILVSKASRLWLSSYYNYEFGDNPEFVEQDFQDLKSSVMDASTLYNKSIDTVIKDVNKEMSSIEDSFVKIEWFK